VTDAPEAPAQLDPIEDAIASFRRQLEGQISVPASVVQDGLLDLWGHLPEGESRAEVERWLTETLERNLYSVGDVDARLSSVLPAD
jgi:hypothetical protein